MKLAYCDCFSGISGDMFLGALVDAGLPQATLDAWTNFVGQCGVFNIVKVRCDHAWGQAKGKGGCRGGVWPAR